METIILAAIKISKKKVIVALQPESRHCEFSEKGEEGFLTSTGRFVDRFEARNIALNAGQVKETEFQQIYSEELW